VAPSNHRGDIHYHNPKGGKVRDLLPLQVKKRPQKRTLQAVYRENEEAYPVVEEKKNGWS